MKATTDVKFRRLVRELRKAFPPLLPVRVYRRELKEDVGYCDLKYGDNGKPNSFVIVIHSPMAWQTSWDTLVHEWAHAIAWTEGVKVSDHGPEWGLAMSRIYQHLEEKNR